MQRVLQFLQHGRATIPSVVIQVFGKYQRKIIIFNDAYDSVTTFSYRN